MCSFLPFSFHVINQKRNSHCATCLLGRVTFKARPWHQRVRAGFGLGRGLPWVQQLLLSQGLSVLKVTGGQNQGSNSTWVWSAGFWPAAVPCWNSLTVAMDAVTQKLNSNHTYGALGTASSPGTHSKNRGASSKKLGQILPY